MFDITVVNSNVYNPPVKVVETLTEAEYVAMNVFPFTEGISIICELAENRDVISMPLICLYGVYVYVPRGTFEEQEQAFNILAGG